MVHLPRRSSGDDESIYRSERGEQRIKQQYRDFLDTLSIEVERRWIETESGTTHVLVAGDPSAQPLFVFHGANFVNPVTLSWFRPLTESFRIYAPDLLGQPGFSAPKRWSPESDALGIWVTQLLDELDLEQAPMVGLSYGASVILKLASVAPERIARAGLLVPAGFDRVPLIQLLVDLGWPAMRYRYFPTRSNLETVIRRLFAEPPADIDDEVIEHVGTVLRSVKLEVNLPPAATAEELSSFTAPVFVAAASDDPLFPSHLVLARAREVLSNLEVSMRLDGERHIPSPAARRRTMAYLATFLTE